MFQKFSSKGDQPYHKKGMNLEWIFKDQTKMCTFHKSVTGESLPEVKFTNGDIRCESMSELQPQTFVVDDIIQCRDMRSQDPQNRQFWYEVKVIKTTTNKEFHSSKYVVQSVNNPESKPESVPTIHASSICLLYTSPSPRD